jgi:hypothetical protein
VLLDGTLNAAVDVECAQPFFADLRRVLRPGGRLRLRLVSAREHVGARPARLPAWAAKLELFPTSGEAVDALSRAGLAGIKIEELDETPAWADGGVELRDLEIVAFQPSAGSGRVRDLAVLYRGPFREVVDSAGRIYPRGQRVAVSEQTWNELRRGEFAEQFLFAVPDAKGSCGGEQ